MTIKHVLAPALSVCIFSSGCTVSTGDPESSHAPDVAASRSALQPDEVTIGPPGKDMNYYWCASDFGTCTIGSGKRYVAYGVDTRFRYKLVGGNVSCDPTTFGGDPAVGVAKSCYISNYGTTPSMPSTGLALENQTAQANGNVAYGANGAFYFKTFNGSFTCNSATFGGDPIAGVQKACYIAAPTYTRVASEGETITGLVDNPIAFGAGGRFIYILGGAQGTTDGNFNTTCGVGSAFQTDPAVGVVKDCYKLIDGHLNTPTAQLQSQEGLDWVTNTNQSTSVFYGSGFNGNFVQTTVSARTGACNNAAGDPHPGQFKYCFNAPVPGPIQGTWTKLQNPFPDSPVAGIGSLSLMPDGSVMANSAGKPSRWFRLTAGSNGKFATGTWTRLADSNLGRVFFPAAVLRDARLLVCGGEYLFDQNGVQFPQVPELNHSRCEIYNPANNSWTNTTDFPLNTYLADGLMAPLPNGKILVGSVPDATSMEFDPLHATDSLAWTQPELATVPAGVTDSRFFGEGSFTVLRDGSVFLAQNGFDRYNPTGPTGSRWAPSIPAPPLNPFNGEGAAALTLYNGEVLSLGASSYNAVFNPTNSTVRNVAQTPQVFPGTFNEGIFGAADEVGQSVMPTGHVLVIAHSSYGYYKFFDYDPTIDAFADVTFGAPAIASETSGFSYAAQTPLPDGSVLVAAMGTSDVYVYTPPGSQLTSQGQPTLSSITGPVSGVYTLTGTTLNGLTNGSNRDDEGSNYTSFPVVSVTSGSTTRYCDVTSVNSSSIAPGAPVTVKFRAPRAGWPGHGTLTIRVSASGLKSSNSKTISVP